jgi:hypothetical protein
VPVPVPVKAFVNAAHEIGMVVRVDFLEHFHGGAGVAANLIRIDALDSEPGDSRMPRRVRHDVRTEAGRGDVGSICFVDRADRRTVELDKIILAITIPSAQVREQSRRNGYGRLALLGVLRAGPTVEDAAFQIDLWTAFRRRKCSC